ncbi:MAG: hypothetical protein HC888_00105 [Candidatus Competibacteraceae bacterium]|nr:hypothetical protein [Candidatus Competibacteraceae bacterium]
MSWYRVILAQTSYEFEAKVKDRFKTHPFFQSLLKDYHIPVEDIDNSLKIEVMDLQGKFAEGNGHIIRVDDRVAQDLETNFHFLVHEFYHWVKRRSEAMFYFNDPEEIQSFTLAIAWELMRGKTEQDVTRSVFPIIEAHYIKSGNAKEMFAKMVDKAKEIVANYNA